ncbi:MAG: DedA family protein [Gemmataceae bacterium]
MEQFLQTWSYLGVFITIIGTGAGLPIPEELPVVVGGAIAGGGHAYWWIMLPVTIVAVILGDSVLYMIGRYWGPSIVQRPFVKKHILPPERLQKIEDNFHNYGIRILLFARLTPGIRAPIFLTAGIVRLPLIRFIIADGIYAVPGVSLLFYLGYVFTEQMVSLVENEFEHVKSIIILVVVLAVAGYFLYRFLRKPMVTGEPEDVPKLAEQAVHALDSVKMMLHHDKHGHDKHGHDGRPLEKGDGSHHTAPTIAPSAADGKAVAGPGNPAPDKAAPDHGVNGQSDMKVGENAPSPPTGPHGP